MVTLAPIFNFPPASPFNSSIFVFDSSIKLNNCIVQVQGIQVSRLKYLSIDEYKKIKGLYKEWVRKARGLIRRKGLVKDKARG